MTICFEENPLYELSLRSLLTAEVDPDAVVHISSMLPVVEGADDSSKLILADPAWGSFPATALLSLTTTEETRPLC